jgi:hypothetical protein
MPPLRRPRRAPKPDRRRALELLASCRDDCMEAIMLAHGITVEMLVGLIEAGLASASAERVRAGNKAIEVARVRITEAGRRTRKDYLILKRASERARLPDRVRQVMATGVKRVTVGTGRGRDRLA